MMDTKGSRAIKARGRKAENDVVEVLQAEFPGSERRRQVGFKDRGDIAGVPNTVIQVKDWKRVALAGWLRDLEEQIAHDGARTGVVIHKKSGTANAGLWYATMPVWRWIELLVAALAYWKEPSE